MKIAAIPTMYKGIQYRSRLEARYAVMFDMYGWGAQYEAIDLSGYIPDFIIDASHLAVSTLVEVKGVASLYALVQEAPKIINSGFWAAEGIVSKPPNRRWALLLGTRPELAISIIPYCGKLCVRQMPANPFGNDKSTWADAGNIVQYKRCVESDSELD